MLEIAKKSSVIRRACTSSHTASCYRYAGAKNPARKTGTPTFLHNVPENSIIPHLLRPPSSPPIRAVNSGEGHPQFHGLISCTALQQSYVSRLPICNPIRRPWPTPNSPQRAAFHRFADITPIAPPVAALSAIAARCASPMRSAVLRCRPPASSRCRSLARVWSSAQHRDRPRAGRRAHRR